MLKLINAFIRGGMSASHLTNRSLSNRVYIGATIASDSISNFETPVLVVKDGVVWSSTRLPKSRDSELINLALEDLDFKVGREDVLEDIKMGVTPSLGIYPLLTLRSGVLHTRRETLEGADMELMNMKKDILELCSILEGQRGLTSKILTYAYIHVAIGCMTVKDVLFGESYK